jgi:hypothetical protein
LERFRWLGGGVEFFVEDRFNGCDFVLLKLGFDIEFDVKGRDM